MRDLLKLFHPAMPYLTEELWQHVVGDGLLAGADWPDVPVVAGPTAMGDIQELITGVRRFRADQGLSPRQRLEVKVLAGVETVQPWAAGIIADLASVDVTTIEVAPEGGHSRIVTRGLQGFIGLEGVIDLDAERARIDKAITGVEDDLAKTEKKLGNPSFVDKAPADVVAKERFKQAEFESLLEKLRAQRGAL
jgi:valyl-tRNA synthetase